MPQTVICNEDDASDPTTPSALALTGQVAHHRPLLPPIERIPTETLDAIFTIVHESSGYSLNISSKPPSLSLPLSQVCSRWRKTIRSRPSLWASLLIDVDRVREGILHILKVHLENAGSHPLRIELRDRSNTRSISGIDVLRMIIPEIQRCEEFTFYGGWSGFAVPAHYFGGSFAFPHLHTLITNASFTILLEEYGLARTFSWFSHALKNAPKLVTVESLNVVPSELFPCHQLTTVRSGRLEVTEMARILLSCSNLKKLVVDTLSDDGPPPDVIVHSSLRELTIRTPPDWLVEIVNSLAQFSLPALQMFELDISGDSDEVQVPTGLTSAVVAAIQCFSASLRKLVLMVGARDIDRTLCRDVLQICPDLYCFGFKVYAVHPEDDSGTENRILHLIQDLTITDTSQAFLAPKLVELCLLEFDSRMTAEYATTFLDMVESRSAAVGVTRLMDAELQYFHDWELQPGPNHIDTCISDSSIVERIEVLSRKGIHCAIVSIDD